MDESKYVNVRGHGALRSIGFSTMENKSFHYTYLFCLLAGLPLFIMASCVSNGQEANNRPTPTIPRSQIVERTIAQTETTSPLPVLTDTDFPSSTAEPTWTPQPTLPPDKVDTFIDSMNNECELPCWGNIIPGKTSEEEAKHILSSFATIIESTSFYFSYHQMPTVIDLTIKDGVVDVINLPAHLTESYKLRSLLSRYGEPEDVRMEVIPETAEGTSWFYLAAYYPQKGILAIYSGEGKVIDSKVNACFDKIAPELYLLKASTYSLEEMNNMLDPILRNMLEPIESLITINKNQFYEFYNQPTEQCLATKVQVP
jgi:hypothetical protein